MLIPKSFLCERRADFEMVDITNYNLYNLLKFHVFLGITYNTRLKMVKFTGLNINEF